MTTSSRVRTQSATLTQPIPVPTLTVLPPSSDTESWSRSPSPGPPRSGPLSQSHRSRTRTKRRQEEPAQTFDVESVQRGPARRRRHAPSERQREDSPSQVLLLPPARSWSRSPSPSRRSRWSLRSLLSRDSDLDSCSTASNSPRSTPGSSPSLRRRVLGGGKASEGEGGAEKSGGGGGGSDSPLPSVPSASSLSSAYPLASRHFSRNAKVRGGVLFPALLGLLSGTERVKMVLTHIGRTECLMFLGLCAQITIQLKDVTSMTKEKTAKLIPNAIQINTENEKHFFTSFGARERSFMMIFRLWQNALLDKSLSPKELWHIVHQCYGTELGLTSEDDDYVSPTSEHMNGLLPGDESVSVTDLLDLSTVSAPSAGSSPPSASVHCGLTSPASAPVLSGTFLPSSASCPPIEVPSSSGSRLGSEPLEPSPPSSHGSLPTISPSVSASVSAAASFTLDEGGDSQSESANPMPPPPAAASLGNLSSLDITNDEELPTDPSNSSDTQEETSGEVEAFCADLSGRLNINTVVRMSVDKLHDLLFSADTHFIQHLFSQRHFTGTQPVFLLVSMAMVRVSRLCRTCVSLSLRRTAAGFSCRGGVPGSVLFLFLAELTPPGASLRLSAGSAGGTADPPSSMRILPVQCCSFIWSFQPRWQQDNELLLDEKPDFWDRGGGGDGPGPGRQNLSAEGEVCKLETLLQTEVSVVTTGEDAGPDAAKTPPSLRRRKRTCSRRQSEREGGGAEGGERGERGAGEERNRRETSSQFMKLGDRSRGGGPTSISTILLIVSFMICISLVVLVVLNMLLFYKLYALEKAAHTLERWHSYSVADSPLPQTAGEWAQVLHLQRQFHQAQLSKWQQILQSSVSLLDQMKHSLEKLHRNIEVPELQDPPDSLAEPPSET
ncbi:PREDICTED: GRAM domain-containing protein 1A-like [Cyprinodon variegatus]|uniref:GRAM domain-containing protein 1A-like n=1 Tax=Cyprinodon variegatus TaxID=28743 RepID=UPI000742CA12|nr:PREDICTED: GRAM domain-containing protein 1A-like [Cyprinodon variegatus]